MWGSNSHHSAQIMLLGLHKEHCRFNGSLVDVTLGEYRWISQKVIWPSMKYKQKGSLYRNQCLLGIVHGQIRERTPKMEILESLYRMPRWRLCLTLESFRKVLYIWKMVTDILVGAVTLTWEYHGIWRPNLVWGELSKTQPLCMPVSVIHLTSKLQQL